MDRILNIGFVKRDGKLYCLRKEDRAIFDKIVSELREGQKVFATYDFSPDSGRLSQIAKLKVGTRELARQIGDDFDEIEYLIKKKAGLWTESTDTCKSFGDCSISELSDAIAAMISIGDFNGMNLR